jgi:glutamate-ammonia-ligase adenylyltransferase
MGESPLLAAQLARRPVLLDAVITGGFFASLPPDDAAALAELGADLEFTLRQASSYEGLLDLARRWANDRRFQIGVLLLQRKLDGDRAARDFSLVAEATVASLLPAARAEFARNHGVVERGSFAVLALGKLGSREMNVLSDIDLIFVYDAADPTAMSSGPRPLPVSTYFARLGQRVINALSAPTAEGGLYAVDMRLRPAGNAGPIASSLEAFRRYYEDQAWTWERMALTRARVIAGDAALVATVRAEVERILTRPSDPATLAGDVIEMRARIERAHPHPKPWDCKHRRGALVDLEFVAQYLMLRHAPDDPSLLCWQTAGAFRNLAAAGWLDRDLAASGLRALGFWQRLQQGLRVLLGKVESAEVAPDVLALALASTGENTGLDRAAETGMAVFERVIGARAGGQESPAQPRPIPGTRS